MTLGAKFLARATAYLLITFPLAVVWHVVAFGETYRALGYFGREQPILALGLLSITVQGLLLAYLYPLFARLERPAAQLVLVSGLFLWTSHVLADAAKFAIAPVPLFVGLETVYLALQFALYWGALRLIERRAEPQRAGAH